MKNDALVSADAITAAGDFADLVEPKDALAEVVAPEPDEMYVGNRRFVPFKAETTQKRRWAMGFGPFTIPTATVTVPATPSLIFRGEKLVGTISKEEAEKFRKAAEDRLQTCEPIYNTAGEQVGWITKDR